MSQSPKIMSHLNNEVFPRMKHFFVSFFTIREVVIKLNMRLFKIQKGYFKTDLRLPIWLIMG